MSLSLTSTPKPRPKPSDSSKDTTSEHRPFPGQGVYAATKAGVVAFTVVLAKAPSEYGITANCINPGTVDTPMVQQWLEENAAESDLDESEFLEDALDLYIADRMGQPREIGHVTTMLLSDEGDWITGEAINVDGGYTKMWSVNRSMETLNIYCTDILFDGVRHSHACLGTAETGQSVD
jgi:NAD(P)-dependent dehydrogenase (short-subunit alcohol dehydrogenase family)